MKNTKKGFTLIELLVVIAIIGILSSVVLASLNTARAKSRDARRLADLQQIKLAAELFFDANSSEYPADIYAASGSLSPDYIGSVPLDPLGDEYAYELASSSTDYCLGAYLENTATASSTQSDESCIASLAGVLTPDDVNYAVAP
ncbi:MAG: ral secretion pathway protein [Patescibacteria group bacterium]|jgi:prepilin-type N-terminal cleavage/methylation domain-containing protein|nr:ral secretion pathway protein [Patescibacteria group bacterium]